MVRTALALMALLGAGPAVAGQVPADLLVVTTEFPPYSYVSNGKLTGTATAVVRRALDRLGAQPAIEVHSWPRALEMARRRPNTLLYQVARTPEREAEFKWVGTVACFDVRLYARAGSRIPPLDAVEDAAGYRVGGLLHDVKTEYLLGKGVPVTTFTDEQNGTTMLLRGRIDLMASDAEAMRFRLQRSGHSAEDVVPVLRLADISTELYAAFGQGTADAVVDTFRDALVTVPPCSGAGTDRNP